jgi:hypothetical protein
LNIKFQKKKKSTLNVNYNIIVIAQTKPRINRQYLIRLIIDRYEYVKFLLMMGGITKKYDQLNKTKRKQLTKALKRLNLHIYT